MTEADCGRIIAGMTLEQKIGQMFMGNVCGGESLDSVCGNLEEFHFGGLQFSGVFERFVRGGNYLPCGVCGNFPLEEVAAFISGIKKAALEITGIPVFMGGDQEGGISGSIFRRRDITLMPLPMGIGACGSPEDACAAASVSAKEVKAMGINMLYGPCLDVNTNPLNPEIGARSFSDDAETTASLGVEYIRAYAEQNIISTAKHFPGRGHGNSNAHHELESINLSRERLDRVELLPFRRAAAAGVDSVMVGHTMYPALDDSGLPSSLSPAVIQGLLREEMGFDGVIIPDTLTMFAISRNYEVPEACVMCLEAGADMIFMKVTDLYRPVVDAIKKAVSENRLAEDRIDASVERVLKLKARRGLFAPPEFRPEAVSQIVGCEEHKNTASRLARKALAAMEKEPGIIPLPGGGNLLAVIPRDMNVVLSNDKNMSHDMLPNALKKYFPGVESIIVDERPTEHQSFEAVGRAKNSDIIIFGIYSSGLSGEQEELLASLAAMGKDVIAVITGSPYPALKLPSGVKASVFTFGLTPFSFSAAAEFLAGKRDAPGKLPAGLSEEMRRRHFTVPEHAAAG